MFTLGSALLVLLPLPPFSCLNRVQDVILDDDTQEVEGPAYLFLQSLEGVEPSLLLGFVPVSLEALIKSLELSRLNDDILPSARAEVGVYAAQVLEERCQFVALDGQEPLRVVLDVEALADLLERVLLGEGFEFKVVELEGGPKRRHFLEGEAAFGGELLEEAGGVELLEEVVDEGPEADVEDLAFLGVLVLEVGQHGVVLDCDGAGLLPPRDALLQLIDVYPPLVHVIIQPQPTLKTPQNHIITPSPPAQPLGPVAALEPASPLIASQTQNSPSATLQR